MAVSDPKMTELMGSVVLNGRLQENLGPIYDKLDDMAIRLADLEETLEYIIEKLNELTNNL